MLQLVHYIGVHRLSVHSTILLFTNKNVDASIQYQLVDNNKISFLYEVNHEGKSRFIENRYYS